MQQHGSKYFACRHLSPTLGLGSKGQNSTLSEHFMLNIKLKGITNAQRGNYYFDADPTHQTSTQP